MIEIFKMNTAHMSHPAWVRGLKQRSRYVRCYLQLVAPRVGAWIETTKAEQSIAKIGESHPAWVRGLKQTLMQF